MNRILYIIIFFLIVTPCYAQPGAGGFFDFGPNYSTQIYNDTSFFNDDGILGASDVTVQDALQTLSNLDQQGVPCATTDNWCFSYNATDEQLVLYVNSVAQAKWPQTAAISGTDVLLLELGDALLLENGTDKILLE